MCFIFRKLQHNLGYFFGLIFLLASNFFWQNLVILYLFLLDKFFCLFDEDMREKEIDR
jgi:hypothetical protein